MGGRGRAEGGGEGGGVAGFVGLEESLRESELGLGRGGVNKSLDEKMNKGTHLQRFN